MRPSCAVLSYFIPAISGWLAAIFVLLPGSFKLTAQSITYNKDVAPIIKANCNYCHKKGGAAPLAFETYEQVKANSGLIKYVINAAIMPPWYADTVMHNLLNRRSLGSEQIRVLNEWIAGGMPRGEGTATTVVEPPAFEVLGKPDMVLKMKKPHKIRSDNKDEFFNVVLDFPLKKDEQLRAVKIVPGNQIRVHHARIEIVDSAIDFKLGPDHEILESGLGPEEIARMTEVNCKFIYVPGLYYTKFPKGCSYRLHKGQQVVLLMHYAPGNLEQWDDTQVELFFDKTNDSQRPAIYYGALFKDFTQILPANEETTIHMLSKPLKEDMSIMSVQLHMHLLGKEMSLRAITPQGDTIPIMRIPKWNFYWQEFYYFKNYVVVPSGSIIETIAVFDNTDQNPLNPNVPPQPVSFGDMTTSNEMLGFIIEYTPTEKGDKDRPIEY